MYKIFAGILKSRIEADVEEELQTTQYGFRKNRSTADAIYLVRRMLEYPEKNKQSTLHGTT